VAGWLAGWLGPLRVGCDNAQTLGLWSGDALQAGAVLVSLFVNGCYRSHSCKVVLEIAMDDPDRNTSLGIFYDELLRKEVENKCGQLGAAWDYSSLFLEVDEGMLRKARRFVFMLACWRSLALLAYCVMKGV